MIRCYKVIATSTRVARSKKVKKATLTSTVTKYCFYPDSSKLSYGYDSVLAKLVFWDVGAVAAAATASMAL